MAQDRAQRTQGLDAEQSGEETAEELCVPPLDEGMRHLVVGAEGNGMRIDRYLALQLPDVSRSRIQQWIADLTVQCNGAAVRPRAAVYAGDQIAVAPGPEPQRTAYLAQSMPLSVVWEDEGILVIDKPAGLVVHPGAGNWSATLLNGLLAYDARLAQVPRAGIVHRLDAGTSGLLVVARTGAAQLDLVRQLQARTVVRQYWALVAGAVAPTVTIDAPIGRDPRNPVRFCVSRSDRARTARTFVRCLAQWKFGDRATPISWIACRLDTGRTHQIRVHLESIGHPLIGDPLYTRHLPAALRGQSLIDHQALHACVLALEHPTTQQRMGWTSAPPPDLATLMRTLGARPRQLQPSLEDLLATSSAQGPQ